MIVFREVEIFTDYNGIANLGYFSLGRSIGITTKMSGYVDSANLITVTDDDKPSVIELAKLEYTVPKKLRNHCYAANVI